VSQTIYLNVWVNLMDMLESNSKYYVKKLKHKDNTETICETTVETYFSKINIYDLLN